MPQDSQFDWDSVDMLSAADAFDSNWALYPKVLYELPLDSYERDIFQFLFCHYNLKNRKPVHPSQSTIADKIGCSTSTVRRKLNNLKQYGLVREEMVTDYRGMDLGYQYELYLPPPESGDGYFREKAGGSQSEGPGSSERQPSVISNHSNKNQGDKQEAPSSVDMPVGSAKTDPPSDISPSEGGEGGLPPEPQGSEGRHAKQEKFKDWGLYRDRLLEELGKLKWEAQEMVDYIAEANKSGQVTVGRACTLLKHFVKTRELYGEKALLYGLQQARKLKKPSSTLHKYARGIARNWDSAEDGEPAPPAKEMVEVEDVDGSKVMIPADRKERWERDVEQMRQESEEDRFEEFDI